METITFVPNCNKTRKSGDEKKLSSRESSFIANINLILELIIGNTLMFNKLTSAEDICKGISFLTAERSPGPGSDREFDTSQIETLCDALCLKNGILIKLERNGKSYYKLNHLERIKNLQFF